VLSEVTIYKDAKKSVSIDYDIASFEELLFVIYISLENLP